MTDVFLRPIGEKEGPAAMLREDEGEQVHQFRDLILLTLPSRAAMGPALSPMGRGKAGQGEKCLT